MDHGYVVRGPRCHVQGSGPGICAGVYVRPGLDQERKNCRSIQDSPMQGRVAAVGPDLEIRTSLNQCADHCGMAAPGGGMMERGSATLVPGFQVCAGAQKVGDDGGIGAAAGRAMERGSEIGGLSLGIRPRVQQRSDHRSAVTGTDRVVQRCRPIPVARSECGTGRHQVPDQRGIGGRLSGHVQRRGTVIRTRVQIAPGIDQQTHGISRVIPGRPMQRAIAEVVWRLEISSPFQQQPGNAGMLVHYRPVERRLTICAARMQIRPGIQQQFDDGGIVACPGGQVQRQISVALACFEIRAGRDEAMRGFDNHRNKPDNTHCAVSLGEW